MKCNACWKNLEGRAVATTCGHIFCSEDAEKITSSADSSCPMCEQMLSKSKIKAVDIAPSDEWINMVMAGVAPQSIMKSAFKGVNFWVGQKDVEVQLSMNKAVYFRHQCEQMQAACSQKMRQVEEACTAKIQQVQAGYQKAMKKIQGMEQEKEAMANDKKEIQEKYTEKSRQKRKLEEMYDALMKKHEQLKRSVASPTRTNQAVEQQPNPYAFTPTFKDLRQVQPPGLTGLPKNSPENTADVWPRQATQQGPFDMPSVPQQVRSQWQASGTGFPQPYSGGPRAMYNSTRPSPFNTPVNEAQPSDTFRNLLRSPSIRQHQGRRRGL